MKLNMIASIVLVAVMSSCYNPMNETIKGNGNITTDTRNIAASAFKCYGSYDVVVTQGSPGSVKIEADENIIPYIVTEMKDGALEIKTKNDVNLDATQKVKLTITTDKLEAFDLAGSGNVAGSNKFTGGDHLDLKVAGTGNIDFAVNTPSIQCEIAGTGNINLTGETRDASVKIAGAGDYNADNLKSENTKITIAGTGNAKIFAEQTLDVNIAGMGDVSYKGNASITQHIAGSGKIKKIE